MEAKIKQSQAPTSAPTLEELKARKSTKSKKQFRTDDTEQKKLNTVGP
jgi:hypothetical protein